MKYQTYMHEHQPEPLFQIGGITYHAADADCVGKFTGDCVINLTSTHNVSNMMNVPELKEHFNISFEELLLPWKDGSIPDVKPSFWKALHNYFKNKKYSHICFHCYAGHGRTGTALSAIMIANGGWEASAAVEHIRSNYCREAVETTKQVYYLYELDYLLNERKIPALKTIVPSHTNKSAPNIGKSYNHSWSRDK